MNCVTLLAYALPFGTQINLCKNIFFLFVFILIFLFKRFQPDYPSDEINEGPDEIDLALKAFDVKDCFIHVKALSTRLDELNEEIIQYLILNAGSKQQAK